MQGPHIASCQLRIPFSVRSRAAFHDTSTESRFVHTREYIEPESRSSTGNTLWYSFEKMEARDGRYHRELAPRMQLFLLMVGLDTSCINTICNHKLSLVWETLVRSDRLVILSSSPICKVRATILAQFGSVIQTIVYEMSIYILRL